jgi:hypothetical protein
MARVIDRITYSSTSTHRYPERAQFGDGVMAILDPQEIRSVPDLAGKIARIERPDGGSEELAIHHSEVHHGVVGLFFQRTDEARIPRLSVVTWEAT